MEGYILQWTDKAQVKGEYVRSRYLTLFLTLVEYHRQRIRKLHDALVVGVLRPGKPHENFKAIAVKKRKKKKKRFYCESGIDYICLCVAAQIHYEITKKLEYRTTGNTFWWGKGREEVLSTVLLEDPFLTPLRRHRDLAAVLSGGVGYRITPFDVSWQP